MSFAWASTAFAKYLRPGRGKDSSRQGSTAVLHLQRDSAEQRSYIWGLSCEIIPSSSSRAELSGIFQKRVVRVHEHLREHVLQAPLHRVARDLEKHGE